MQNSHQLTLTPLAVVLKSKQSPLVVGGISVKQKETLYCLNDLHKAAGGERRHEISNWMMLKSTSEEIEYLSENTVIPVFKKVAGRNGGQVAA